jgi:ArsR family transcriptional regulator, zinc-responsive transcriptional repressor
MDGGSGGDDAGLAAAAELFRTLGSTARLRLLRELGDGPRTVSALVAATGLSQPLVSQHLRVLRQTGLVGTERRGKEIEYRTADEHVTHVIADALAHVQEPGTAAPAEPAEKETA